VIQSSFTLQDKQSYEARIQALLKDKQALEAQLVTLKNDHQYQLKLHQQKLAELK